MIVQGITALFDSFSQTEYISKERSSQGKTEVSWGIELIEPDHVKNTGEEA